ncbi:glutaredoxin family protein [Demequina gelatinilytica]|uniref:glutaredoxin family protein n=1 Tax=Demequina gelatinilytica TaxID=1638980 RepID=UPI00078291D1|nr:glutaredoxin family protein [Demequina gelatinilytica]
MRSRAVLYSRVGCHLCDDARAVLVEVCGAAGEGFDEIDIDGDPELRARYGDEIPVVTVDDEVVGFWRIDPERVRKALA